MDAQRNELATQRSFTLKRMDFSADEYPDLKTFFSKVKDGDGLQAVLYPATTAEQNGH